jgi:hypothetical protein
MTREPHSATIARGSTPYFSPDAQYLTCDYDYPSARTISEPVHLIRSLVFQHGISKDHRAIHADSSKSIYVGSSSIIALLDLIRASLLSVEDRYSSFVETSSSIYLEEKTIEVFDNQQLPNFHLFDFFQAKYTNQRVLAYSLDKESNWLLSAILKSISEDDTDEAFDLLFEQVDTWLNAKNWDQVKNLFHLAISRDVELSVLIGFLTVTLPYKQNLDTSRKFLFAFSRQKAFKKGGEGKVKSALQGLE